MGAGALLLGTTATVLVVLGFVLNRLNVSITGIQGAMPDTYFPSLLEVAVTATLVVAGFAAFAMAVRHLPVFPEEPEAARQVRPSPVPRPVFYATRGSLVALAAVLAAGALALEPKASSGAEAGVVAPEPEPAYWQLPGILTYARAEESLGPVEFDHEFHVDADDPEESQQL